MPNRALEKDAHRLAEKHPKHSVLIWSVVHTPPGDESESVIDGLEMIAFDNGYEGGQLSSWVIEIAKVLKVDVRKQHSEGYDAANQKLASALSRLGG